ncbi:MAG: hypothetical protein UR90_C0004G0017 [Parcubacteria group bacterium GW2011_GWC1_35_8]|uniref:Type II toxin-antitoxin system mRNA interferase toxin, RelE/StbE family n=3 Tax=Candidatus Nomuraibacteriota TaxID=1752729 RepID=A0A1F6YTN1_9BACT|nr:MAG: hypothetical protein UR90_C0004G0017 [Parcubacteria group bacterium GW2011_GWC1_35_8]KKP89839.1 MAG: hypothetical protein UR91_C0001G0028 [Candidatus Nomurabacteria bacterium GW2011_GWC2_35_8]OGJ05472.1 MAG: hypothetical protein A2238_01595 [Candidatus Nomurabacteria bacterium RIFOXYA2_FULL_35_9]OGJ06139.1 MAG: hypothetical protein A2192_01865 [Candidatus Nomurabacteria bacterium RIFOXYA1_FULL_35_17]OGJ09726.1 MAG: hypothetical protein A2456_00195 [Candidatus Nomurabacteria bacterium RI
MRIDYHKRFLKQYEKLSSKIKLKFGERLKIFITDPLSQELYNHPLHGEYLGYRSINITGDLRAVYEVQEGVIKFLFIDTHSNLYK